MNEILKGMVPGAVVGWSTWTGAVATATVALVGPYRISTDKPNIYWEATCFRTLAESVAATRGFHIVEAKHANDMTAAEIRAELLRLGVDPAELDRAATAAELAEDALIARAAR